MKIASSHLEEIRALLVEQSAALDSETKSANAATDAREKRSATVRGLRAGFDVVAASFAQDSELSKAQVESLPAACHQVLGFSPAEPAA
jgi:hypothetical protein